MCIQSGGSKFSLPRCETSCQAENSLIKQPADGLDSSEGKGGSSAVKVPEDQDEYAEAFEQDDHTETAEPEKANVKEVETVEVEGQVPKTGDAITTLPDSQGDSQPADETDMRRQSTHDWEEDFEVDDGEDPANGTASKASAKDTTEPSMTTNVASKNEVESEPTEESPGPEKATGSESSLLPLEAQTLGTSVPSSSLMVSQSENGNQMGAPTGQKAKATPQEEAVLPNGSTASEIVPAQKGTSNEVVEEERKSSKNSDFPEGSQAKVASRPETEIEETNSMEVKGVEEAYFLGTFWYILDHLGTWVRHPLHSPFLHTYSVRRFDVSRFSKSILYLVYIYIAYIACLRSNKHLVCYTLGVQLSCSFAFGLRTRLVVFPRSRSTLLHHSGILGSDLLGRTDSCLCSPCLAQFFLDMQLSYCIVFVSFGTSTGDHW